MSYIPPEHLLADGPLVRIVYPIGQVLLENEFDEDILTPEFMSRDDPWNINGMKGIVVGGTNKWVSTVLLSCGSRLVVNKQWLKPIHPLEQLAGASND